MLTMLNMNDCTCGRAPRHAMYHAERCPLWVAYDKEANKIVDDSISASASVPIDINQALRDAPPVIRVTIKGLRFFKFRVFVGVLFIRFGIWVCGLASVTLDGGGD